MADYTLRAQLASVLEGGGRVAPEDIDELVELADELTGLTLAGIRRRPAELHSMQAGLEAQLLGLASGPGCTSFVESAKCAADVRAGLRVMLDRAAALGAVLPAVGVASDTLFCEARHGASERSRLALVLEQYDALVEILEQPQLMISCVRNGLFDEVCRPGQRWRPPVARKLWARTHRARLPCICRCSSWTPRRRRAPQCTRRSRRWWAWRRACALRWAR